MELSLNKIVLCFLTSLFCEEISHLDKYWNTKQERKEPASLLGEHPARLMRKLAQKVNSEAQAWRNRRKNPPSRQTSLKQTISPSKAPRSAKRDKSETFLNKKVSFLSGEATTRKLVRWDKVVWDAELEDTSWWRKIALHDRQQLAGESKRAQLL